MEKTDIKQEEGGVSKKKSAKLSEMLSFAFFDAVHFLIRRFEDASDSGEGDSKGVSKTDKRWNRVKDVPVHRFGDSIHAMMKKAIANRKSGAVRANIMKHGSSIAP